MRTYHSIKNELTHVYHTHTHTHSKNYKLPNYCTPVFAYTRKDRHAQTSKWKDNHTYTWNHRAYSSFSSPRVYLLTPGASHLPSPSDHRRKVNLAHIFSPSLRCLHFENADAPRWFYGGQNLQWVWKGITHTYIYTHICLSTYLLIYLSIYVYVCICI